MRLRYLDPATGSYVIQMLVAGFLGAFYALRGFFFPSAPSEEEDESAEEPAEGDSQEDASEDEAEDAPKDKDPTAAS